MNPLERFLSRDVSEAHFDSYDIDREEATRFIDSPACWIMRPFCIHENYVLVKKTMQNAGYVLDWICTVCGQSATGHGYKRTQSGIDLSLLPEIGHSPSVECEVKGCKNRGYEFHHIFPCSLAYKNGIDPNDYPIVKLCRDHHITWHKIVTPGLVK